MPPPVPASRPGRLSSCLLLAGTDWQTPRMGRPIDGRPGRSKPPTWGLCRLSVWASPHTAAMQTASIGGTTPYLGPVPARPGRQNPYRPQVDGVPTGFTLPIGRPIDACHMGNSPHMGGPNRGLPHTPAVHLGPVPGRPIWQTANRGQDEKLSHPVCHMGFRPIRATIWAGLLADSPSYPGPAQAPHMGSPLLAAGYWAGLLGVPPIGRVLLGRPIGSRPNRPVAYWAGG